MRWLYAGLNFSLTVFSILAVLCAFAQPAYAYVDPGSGLFAFQIISTTVAGMIFMLRRRLHGLIRSLTMHSGPKSEKAAK
jgi:uncharacterized membrane protein (DUF4010 family)